MRREKASEQRPQHQPAGAVLPLGGPQRFAVVAAPAYLAARGTPREPEDLAGHARSAATSASKTNPLPIPSRAASRMRSWLPRISGYPGRRQVPAPLRAFLDLVRRAEP
jgi:hypothetical protein